MISDFVFYRKYKSEIIVFLFYYLSAVTPVFNDGTDGYR